MSIFVGIDPGMTGAISIIDIAEDSITTWDMPLVIARNGKNQLNIPALADMLRSVQAKMQERQGSLAKGPKPIKLEAVHGQKRSSTTARWRPRRWRTTTCASKGSPTWPSNSGLTPTSQE